MHMADALLSPVVGGIMWAGSAGAIAYCSRRQSTAMDERKAPLMGVLGAFIFAAQMINISIPGTGASGHITGSLLLAVLLGPHAAFLTMASVLVVQALFFGDGGLLALGCNIFNLGFIPAFIVFPLCCRSVTAGRADSRVASAIVFLSAVLALQLGSLAVVVETVLSGVSALPFATFASVMQPIHLAIGVIEGAATVAVVSFLGRARPAMFAEDATAVSGGKSPGRTVARLLAGALFMAAVVSWYASGNPDGLEWAISKVAGETGVPAAKDGMHDAAASMQRASQWFPDYELPKGAGVSVPDVPGHEATVKRLGTTVAGIVGTLLTLLVALALGMIFKRRNQAG